VPVLNEGRRIDAEPVVEITEPQLGLQMLYPVTLVLTEAEVGVMVRVPPLRLKSILFASAAVGSAKASKANKTTRLIIFS
jgi:hypothetical protein